MEVVVIDKYFSCVFVVLVVLVVARFFEKPKARTLKRRVGLVAWFTKGEQCSNGFKGLIPASKSVVSFG